MTTFPDHINKAIDDQVAHGEYLGLDPVVVRRECEQFAECAQQMSAHMTMSKKTQTLWGTRK